VKVSKEFSEKSIFIVVWKRYFAHNTKSKKRNQNFLIFLLKIFVTLNLIFVLKLPRWTLTPITLWRNPMPVKKSTKKPAAKKTAAKKPAKKAAAKKPAAKKTAAKKSTAKKPAAKKAPAKKKTAARKPAAKKSAARKPAAKKTAKKTAKKR
jgi:hypothetical protein